MSLTIKQITNFDGFPKAAELIEITGTQALEASDRAIYNHMLQIAHESGKLTEAEAEWVVTLASLRRECSRHEGNDRIRASLRRIRRRRRLSATSRHAPERCTSSKRTCSRSRTRAKRI